MYFQGDKVVYRGRRFPELRSKLGEVCGKVQGKDNFFVVDFGDDSYVMGTAVLERYRPSKEPNAKEPEVMVRRKKTYDEED